MTGQCSWTSWTHSVSAQNRCAEMGVVATSAMEDTCVRTGLWGVCEHAGHVLWPGA